MLVSPLLDAGLSLASAQTRLDAVYTATSCVFRSAKSRGQWSFTTIDLRRRIATSGLLCDTPAFRFYVLYDKIYREDILRHGYALARANAGAPGTDGMTFASGLNRWLAGLREDLAEMAVASGSSASAPLGSTE